MEYLIITLFVITYLGIGVGVTKVVFILNKFLYNEHDLIDSAFALILSIMWPVVAVFGGLVWGFNNLFKRIL